MKKAKISIRFHLIGIAISLAVILYVVWEASRHGETTLYFGDEKMKITAKERGYDIVAYYYEVWRGDELRAAKAHFRDGGGWWPPQYGLIAGADANVVAVTERGEPQVLLVLYDRVSGEAWPGDDMTAGERLLAKFVGQTGKPYRLEEREEDETESLGEEEQQAE